jgi:8-oxo-dGTP diphosphatase
LLGPVEPTPSHSGQPVLGWERFARLAADYPIPVFALGGMQPHHLPQAWRAGAHGIAMMRGAWDAKPQ